MIQFRQPEQTAPVPPPAASRLEQMAEAMRDMHAAGETVDRAALVRLGFLPAEVDRLHVDAAALANVRARRLLS